MKVQVRRNQLFLLTYEMKTSQHKTWLEQELSDTYLANLHQYSSTLWRVASQLKWKRLHKASLLSQWDGRNPLWTIRCVKVEAQNMNISYDYSNLAATRPGRWQHHRAQSQLPQINSPYTSQMSSAYTVSLSQSSPQKFRTVLFSSVFTFPFDCKFKPRNQDMC